MALMSPQSVSSVLTPSFTTPTTSDTINWQSGLLLYVKVGATSTTVTVVVPGNQEYVGSALPDLVVSAVTNTERVFHIPQILADPSSGLVTVTYSQVTNVTSALLKH